MSIKARLIITIALLLAAGILGMVGAVILDARPRIETESESTARLAETLIRSSLVTLETVHDPHQTLLRLVEKLATLRHVKVGLRSQDPAPEVASEQPNSLWERLFTPEERRATEVPVRVKGQLIDVLFVTPIPEDELKEVWAAIGRILEYGALLACVLVLLTSFLITRSLAPIQTLTQALHELAGGNFNVEISERGPPEIAASCRQLNTLAKALSSSRAQVTELSARIVEVQDEERREVVRELHDDLGPHLFALRARAAALERGLFKETPDLDRAIEDVTALAEHIDFVQQTNRRVLNRLVPAGLLELGLGRALTAMCATWRKEQPHIELTASVPERLDHIGETASLTIYRVAQEALTNSYRHSGAKAIDLQVTMTSPEGERTTKRAEVRVRDDGKGLSSPLSLGRGLQGMRERVIALGGTLEFEPNSPQGLCLRATFPI